MSNITLNKGGTAEKVIDVAAIQVPDLWHIAEWLDIEATKKADPRLAVAAEKILDCWHLAHDMKTHIQEAA